MIVVLCAVFPSAVAGTPPPPVGTTGPPSYSPPGVTIQINGRLETGGLLMVRGLSGTEKRFDPGSAALCYKHGSSRVTCTDGDADGIWIVLVLPGRQQYLTLRQDGKVVARHTFRKIRAGLPAALILGPPESSPVFLPPQQILEPWSQPGPLKGPAVLRVGETAYFSSSKLEAATLCYAPGSTPRSCISSAVGGFYVNVQSGTNQHFTLRVDGKVISQLVYHSIA